MNTMTELEASRRQCPFLPNASSCQGSGCALWRWYERKGTSERYGTSGHSSTTVNESTGYCGMAGKP
jgi:hypothetical protein